MGGSIHERGVAIAVDGAGSTYVIGWTNSNDFPTTPGAFDTSRTWYDAFVAKLNPAGSGLAYATFLGGSSTEWGSAIAVDGSGSAYLTGKTSSSDFPTTPGAFDPSFNGGNDAFVAKLAMGNAPPPTDTSTPTATATALPTSTHTPTTTPTLTPTSVPVARPVYLPLLMRQ